MLKNRAISAHLLELEKNQLSEIEREDISNTLSVLVTQITSDMGEVVHLLRREKEIIHKRGLKSNYLFLGDASVQDVFQCFYKNRRVTSNGEERLNENLLLSEMMMMYGTFSWFLEERLGLRAEIKANIRRINKRRNREGVYALLLPIKSDEKQFLSSSLEVFRKEKLEEYRLEEYLNHQTCIALYGVLEALGLTPEEISKEQLTKISKESRKLCSQNEQIDCFFKRRRKRKPMVTEDVNFFLRRGEMPSHLDSLLPEEDSQVKPKIYQI